MPLSKKIKSLESLKAKAINSFLAITNKIDDLIDDFKASNAEHEKNEGCPVLCRSEDFYLNLLRATDRKIKKVLDEEIIFLEE